MSEQRKTRHIAILEAACLEFSEKGFAGARIEEIARKAGIGKSTVYEYFPSKLDLLEGAASWMFGRIVGDITAIMQSTLPFANKIREYLLYMYRILLEIGHGIIYMQGNKKAALEIIQRCSAQFFDVVLDAMTVAVQQAKCSGELRQDVGAVAIAQVVCFLPSPILAHQISPDHEDAVDDMVELLMRGVGAHS